MRLVPELVCSTSSLVLVLVFSLVFYKRQEEGTRDQRVAVFNFGTDRVRVLEKTSGSGSGTDRVRVLALHFYQSGIIGY